MKMSQHYWLRKFSRLTLTFDCSQCSYRHSGGHTNNGAMCPNCSEGFLRPTPWSLERVRELHAETKEELADACTERQDQEFHAL